MLEKTATETECDVLVVGLGPVGAATAALLASRGIDVLAVDRERVMYPLPRAVGFDGDVMRIFQAMGLAEAIQPHVRFSPFYDFLAADGTLLLRYDRSRSGHPSGWAHNVTFFQPPIEALLRQRVVESGHGRIMLGQTFTALSNNQDGVTADLTDDDGVPLRVRARYLIGCDGARSEVRRACGIDLEDYGFDEPWLVVDFLSDDLSGLPDRNVQICDPRRPATYLQMGPGRYRWEFMALGGERAEEMQREETVRRLLAECGVTRTDPIERAAFYRFHGLIARQWRRGRVVLAGDSAHQMPPFAGQGFCSGIRDAFNLAWKMERVLGGRSAPSLLDTYEAERKSQVAFMIRSAIELGRIVCTTDPGKAAARNLEMLANQEAGRVPPPLTYPPLDQGCLLEGSPGAGELFPQPVAVGETGTVRFDDLARRRPILLARRSEDLDGATPDEGIAILALDQPALSPFAGAATAWLDARRAEAVLLRPDHYVFGTGRPKDLIEAFRRQTANSTGWAMAAAEPAADGTGL
jgi:3-(3-hydroxy-phenyl)propionate hydroxylase